MAKKKAARRMTQTPNTGRDNVRIDQKKYDAVRRAIMKAVPRGKEGIAFKELPLAVKGQLPGGAIPGGGSLKWYVTVVKLDMEMRGELARVPDAKPQRLRRPVKRG